MKHLTKDEFEIKLRDFNSIKKDINFWLNGKYLVTAVNEKTKTWCFPDGSIYVENI